MLRACCLLAPASCLPQHQPAPRFPRPQLANWKPTQGGPSGSGGDSGSGSERPKRADRYSSKELASKQRLAELVEQHKAGRAASGKAPKQQGSFRR